MSLGRRFPVLFRAFLAVVLAAGCAPVIRGAGPAVTTPLLEDGLFVAADGRRLPYRTWMPADVAPKAIVVALHGFNDYSKFFDKPGTWLAGRGIASYAFDQRGFGMTPDRGYWPGSEAMAADLASFARLVASRHPGRPLYLLGDSMGGAVTLVAMTGPQARDLAPRVAGVVLVAPAVWGRATMPWYQRWALALGVRIMPGVRLTPRGLNIKPSDNIEMLRGLGRDHLVIKETRTDAIWGLVNLMDAGLAAAARFDAKALILYGGRDEVVPRRPVSLMVERLPVAARGRQRVALYDGGYHMLLRDLEAERVWRDILTWIGDANGPLPSGAAETLLPKKAGGT